MFKPKNTAGNGTKLKFLLIQAVDQTLRGVRAFAYKRQTMPKRVTQLQKTLSVATTADACIAINQGDRAEQQDRVAIIIHPKFPGTMLAVLADGMGGHSGGALAAEQVILKAKQNFADYAPSSESPQEFLRMVIEEAHLIINLSRFTSEQDPHSTAVVMLLQQGRVDWAHCGDSRLYHFRDGKLVTRTQDHSYVGELIRQGKLTEAQASTHPQRNLLLSCLGAERPPRIDYANQTEVQAGDVFLLGSDGLWAYFSDKELGRMLQIYDARSAAKQLVNLARERAEGAGDNLSLAIVKIKETSE